MATYHEITTSNEVTVTDTDAVAALLEDYEFHVEHVDFNETTGTLSVYGDGSPDPYRRFPDVPDDTLETAGVDPSKLQYGTLDEGVPNAFYWRLSQFIKPGDEFVVRTVGFENARYVVGYQYRVTPSSVWRRSLNEDEQLMLPEPHSVTRVQHGFTDSPVVTTEI